ncbi:DUF177 domain-containing protein [Desulforhopalus vacuolatus]|uniref:YceD family protein n=1 Tax=Desulforhopalus vacuolatus TaxID=40414 RepID=UPI0019638AEC|nr:DUF177 domain-containing protein [Desulforhopalus vacuolatus]MBM9518646.1 DUF177 domain-containing protein [Desulforhopalus vacuolatus]
MKLRFEELSDSPKKIVLDNYILTLDSADGRVQLDGVLMARRKREDSAVLHVDVSGKMMIPCSRCATETLWTFSEISTYTLIAGEEPAPVNTEVESREEDVDLLYVTSPEIDVDEILKEQVYLSLPQQILCVPDCKGRCSECGVDLNRAECRCGLDCSTSPFAVLGKLKKK